MAYADKVEVLGEQKDIIYVHAAERNKGPILEVLQQYLPQKSDKGLVFEVASGSGQHIVHFAQYFPALTFLPSDSDVTYLKSIQAYVNKTGVSNVLPPINVDITQPLSRWLVNERLVPSSCDAIININMIHISPWETCQGLMSAAGQLLKTDGFLYLYGEDPKSTQQIAYTSEMDPGVLLTVVNYSRVFLYEVIYGGPTEQPFKVSGIISPESNVQFDSMLQSRNASWGLRDLDDVKKLAEANGLYLQAVVDMPANNKSVIFFKKR